MRIPQAGDCRILLWESTAHGKRSADTAALQGKVGEGNAYMQGSGVRDSDLIFGSM